MGAVIADISMSLDGHLGERTPRLEPVHVRESPNATHIRYRTTYHDPS